MVRKRKGGFTMNLAIIWLVFGAILFITEMLTPSFFLVWFGIGAVVAGIGAFLGLGFGGQWILFFAVSFPLTLLSRRFAKRITKESPIKSNIDEYIGEKAVVLENIDPLENKGLVRVKKEEWRADAEECIPKGTVVEVVGYEGVHLKVKKWNGG